MSIQPLGDRVIVKPNPAPVEEKTESGIHLPINRRQQAQYSEGTVVAVGPGRFSEQMTMMVPVAAVATLSAAPPPAEPGTERTVVSPGIKVGDKILYSFGGIEVKFDGEDCLLLDERSILAINSGDGS